MFSEKLNELITTKNITAKELATKIDISQSAMSYYVNGKQEPTLNVLVKLSDFFHVSVDYLIGRENEYGIVEIQTELSENEQAHLAKYSKLTDKNKTKVDGYIDGLIFEQE